MNYDFEDDEDDDDNNGENGKALNVDLLQEVWRLFTDLMKSMRAYLGSDYYLSPQTFHERARAWAKLFMKATFDDDVTPYIHCKSEFKANTPKTLYCRALHTHTHILILHAHQSL